MSDRPFVKVIKRKPMEPGGWEPYDVRTEDGLLLDWNEREQAANFRAHQINEAAERWRKRCEG